MVIVNGVCFSLEEAHMLHSCFYFLEFFGIEF